MIAKWIAAASLAASLTALPVAAQTAAALLEKGIYAQETAGDADAAIPMYRQILASSVPHALKAQAQSYLVGALLQKGDLAGAAQEFDKLARNYADQEPLVTAMAQRLQTIAQNGPALVLGTFQNGKYRHHWTGAEFTVPADWTFKDQTAGRYGGAGVRLRDANVPPAHILVYMNREKTAPADIAGRLNFKLQHKITVLRAESAGYHAYVVRPDSVQHTIVGGRQALSAVADFIGSGGEKMTEGHTFILSGKTDMYFSVTAASSAFPGVQSQVERIVAGAVIP